MLATAVVLLVLADRGVLLVLDVLAPDAGHALKSLDADLRVLVCGLPAALTLLPCAWVLRRVPGR